MISRPPAGSIPDTPGSYQFKDREGRMIYVGKAKNLRSRLSNYFQNPRKLPARTRHMVESAESVEWIQVANEVEALMLEFSLIQRHKPRFNVRYTDDKSYPFLCLTMIDEWPRAMVIRGRRKKGNRYFGPYGHAYAIRETLDLLLRTFPIRTCSDNKFRDHRRLGKPCLLYHIEKCAGPCVDEVDKEAYDGMVAELISFLAGDADEVIARLTEQMHEASDALEYERAGYFRDRLRSVRKAVEKQQMVFPRRSDADVIGVFDDELEAAVQVFFVRKGRVMGRRGFVVDKAEELDEPELMSRVLERLYFDDNPIGWPKEVLVPRLPHDPRLYEEWISEARGTRVEIRVPQRGDKRRLHETVAQNAEEAFNRHRLKRANDHNSRARALNELQQHLGLPLVPLRIECYDMSHIQGTDYVGSMVVLEDGLPKKSDYRRFQIRSVPGNDDFAAMEEVLTRRLSAYLKERRVPVEERDGRFSYPPQLLVVDGGKGQLGVAERVLAELGLSAEIPVVALAKQFEEVFVPGRSESILLPRQSEALYLLQRIRDESHRFAVAYHRQLRDKRMTRSALDGVAGLGPARKKRLTRELGGVKAVRRAALADLKELSWLPDEVAENIYAHLHRVRPAPKSR
ncbi:MAG: excinuclease ABC subunit UvrC [Acidimicrobiaceae bacterium]|nr:excinuclease ABC subunit UvrC [Acidimicrobiaceae bacterium]